jgi:uncharacterized protein YndB with AHSA1/START domain
MGDYEATTTIQTPPDRLFAYLADVERLPDYLPQMTAAHLVDDHTVDVEAVIQPEGEPPKKVGGEAWIEVVEEGHRLRWGAPGPHDYHGELDVEPAGQDTSDLTVRLHTDHAEGSQVDDGLEHTLAGIKSAVEARST